MPPSATAGPGGGTGAVGRVPEPVAVPDGVRLEDVHDVGRWLDVRLPGRLDHCGSGRKITARRRTRGRLERGREADGCPGDQDRDRFGVRPAVPVCRAGFRTHDRPGREGRGGRERTPLYVRDPRRRTGARTDRRDQRGLRHHDGSGGDRDAGMSHLPAVPVAAQRGRVRGGLRPGKQHHARRSVAPVLGEGEAVRGDGRVPEYPADDHLAAALEVACGGLYGLLDWPRGPAQTRIRTRSDQ